MNELINFSLDTENAEKNYSLANWYENQGHTAPAHTYYLRAAERSDDKILAYKSLLRASFCYRSQGSRDATERVLLENALNLLPERPEAYYFLSLFYERKGDWQSCYTYANLGIQNSDKECIVPEYSGKHLLIFQKAMSSWHWGKGNESRELFELLLNQYYDLMDDRHKNLIDVNVSELGLPSKKRIIDCFRFFNEKELLELRYHMLKDYVDKFIILEGDKTQSGIERKELLAKKYIRELNLPEDKFIVIEKNLPGNDEEIQNNEIDVIFRSRSGNSNDTYRNSLNARTRERLLLDELLTVIPQFSDDNVFMISDCDEIIKPEFINYFSEMVRNNEDKLIKIPLIELQGKANLRAYNVDTNNPVSTDNVFFMCTKKHFEVATPTQLRFDINNPFEVVYILEDGVRIEDCGWHFSWMGDSDRLKLKQKSTSHYADQIESALIQDMNSEEVQTLIENWNPSDNVISVWGDTRIVLKEWALENVPKQIFEHDHLKKFFLTEDNEYKVASKIIQIIDEYDINGAPRDGHTDKFSAHSYLKLYDNVLSEYYDKGGSLLEIGCCYGGSILLWSKLLDNFKIVGLDISSDYISQKVKNILSNHPNTEFIFTNAYDQETVNLINAKYRDKFDVIIDDGPHSEESQIDAIKFYFPLLKDGGTLLIEDIQNYESIEKFKQTVNNFSEYECKIKIHDYRNFKGRYDDLIFVVKKIGLKKSKIPVLGVPIVNGVHWLKRLIDSIDYPVEELFIINNNGRDQITDELDELKKINYPLIDKIRICHLPHNLGVSGAWNLIIKSYLTSPYWIICNNDVAFTPGFLKEMVEKASDSNTEIVWPPSINPSYSASNLGSFECFLFKSSVVEKCGLFDENLYPAYCEDCDYLAKIKCNNIRSQFVYSPYYHGESQSYETGSQTLKIESPEISQRIHEFHMMNREYMNIVWGNDWENWESYSNKTLNSKSYDLSFIKKKYLGF